jgi:palmitoyltransferase
VLRTRVGGPIGENNFKFFVQFTGYTALFCLHLLVVMAVYVHKQVANKVLSSSLHTRNVY